MISKKKQGSKQQQMKQNSSLDSAWWQDRDRVEQPLALVSTARPSGGASGLTRRTAP
jgi:hypothetical protein